MPHTPQFELGSQVNTHDPRVCYDLGVALLVMGLTQWALKYLIDAAVDPGWLPACAAVLGGHYLEEEEPDKAATWYLRGLLAPNVDDDSWIELLRGYRMSQHAKSCKTEYLTEFPSRQVETVAVAC